MPGHVKHRVEVPIRTLPAERLEQLRACAIAETARALVFDADSACYRAAFPPRHSNAAGRKVAEPVQPLPRSQWPLSVRVVARLAVPGEKGVGTTLTRLIAGVGGEVYKRMMAGIGVDCRCSAKAAALDARFPY
jgi:hypothetical protein